MILTLILIPYFICGIFILLDPKSFITDDKGDDIRLGSFIMFIFSPLVFYIGIPLFLLFGDKNN